MPADRFDRTNTPPRVWFISRVQEAEQEATGAIREAQDALHAALDARERAHAALRDPAMVRPLVV